MTMPNGPFWELLEQIGQATDVASLRRASLAATRAIGFTARFVLAPVVPDPKVGRVLTNYGFSPEWEKAYREHYYAIDPLPLIALTHQSAFRWDKDVDRASLTPAQLEYLDLLPSFGMEAGFAVPCFGPFARNGFVAIGHPISEESFSPENRLRAEVSARVAFQRFVQLVQPYRELDPALSQREMEVLRWIGQGKSNAVIAEILAISPSSVDSYVKRLFVKLGVSDRTSASVRALALGLIVSPDFPQRER